MSFNGWEAEQMKDPKFRAAWAKLQPEYWAARKQQMLAIPEVQALVDMLRYLEFSDTEGRNRICPICDGSPELEGHKAGCDLADALAPFEDIGK